MTQEAPWQTPLKYQAEAIIRLRMAATGWSRHEHSVQDEIRQTWWLTYRTLAML